MSQGKNVPTVLPACRKRRLKREQSKKITTVTVTTDRDERHRLECPPQRPKTSLRAKHMSATGEVKPSKLTDVTLCIIDSETIIKILTYIILLDS